MRTPEDLHKSPTVTQDNALLTASYYMTLDEKRLLVASIAKLDPNSKLWKDGRAEVVINADEWAKLYELSPKNAYSQLNGAVTKLYERSVRIYGDSKKGKDIRWLQAKEYDEGAGRVKLIFSGEILYYLTGMIDQFTSYNLLGVSGLKSVYSIRLYELSSQFLNTGWRHINLDDLRSMFSIEDAYPKWGELKRWVIDRSVNEINSKSDLDVSYQTVKDGRKVVAIRLYIKQKQQLDFGADW